MNVLEIDVNEFDLDQKKEILIEISDYFDDEDFFDFLKEIEDEESINFILKYIFIKDEEKRKDLWNQLNKDQVKYFEILKNLKNKTNMFSLNVEEELSVEEDENELKNLEDQF